MHYPALTLVVTAPPCCTSRFPCACRILADGAVGACGRPGVVLAHSNPRFSLSHIVTQMLHCLLHLWEHTETTKIMRADSVYVQWWRQLRSPFVLPPITAKCHVCDWEKIDIDVLGCKLCSKVHEWEYGKCTNLIETSDCLSFKWCLRVHEVLCWNRIHGHSVCFRSWDAQIAASNCIRRKADHYNNTLLT